MTLKPHLSNLNRLSIFFSGAVGSRKFRTDFLQELPTPGTGPYFDTTVPNNLTGLVGKTAYLNCRVKNLGNRTVSLRLPGPGPGPIKASSTLFRVEARSRLHSAL